MKKMEMLLNHLQDHKMIVFVAVVITFDLFVGVLRAIKERKPNSTIGIDGAIRKVGMIGCLCFLLALDFMMKINIVGWLPQQMLDIIGVIGLDVVGLSDMFGLMFIIFEMLSIVKNWALLGLPMFKGINAWILNFLETFTDELPTTNKNKLGDKE